ncbi:MAG: Gfo/Idh/MocA family oxidoreductase [Planctomycetaceae bacterium]|nr:Gfo/Idh/MocA family oxidoreductase [Planctomycetaceae bacterium]
MKRRTFLQTTAASAAFAVQSLHAETATKRRIKVGQIGTKHAHASGQIGTCRQMPDRYEVVGVVEPDESRRKQVENQNAYRGVPWLSEQELLDTPGLEVVAVETEVKDLLPTAQRCLDHGKHIHLDKPAGESFSALQRLHATAKEKSLTIQMGYMYRYNPAFQFLFQAVRNGWLGQIFEVDGVMSKTVNNSTRRELAEYPGGSMFELGCHLIDPLIHLMGPPDRVTAFNRATRNDGLLDNTLAVFEYPKATATIRSALIEVEGNRRRQFIVCGDQGTIVIRPLEAPRLELTLAKDQGSFKKGTQLVKLPSSPGRYHGSWKEMANTVSGEARFPFSHAHDMAVQRAILVASSYRDWDD